MLGAGSVVVVLAPSHPAGAVGARPAFSAPFPCGTQFRTESFGHAPAIDVFRVPTNATEGQLLVAPAGGTVNQSYSNPQGAGNILQINHGGGWFTTYIHLQSRALGVGASVRKGQPIGRIGHTGVTSNGVSHVHFEMAVDRNGDGRADWGAPNPERVSPVWDGVTYGTGDNRSKSGTSRNCTAPTAPATPAGGMVYQYGPQLHVVFRTTGDHLGDTWYAQGVGWRTEDLGGSAGGPAVGVSAYGQQQVFARATNGALYHWWFTAGSGWRSGSLGHAVVGTPTTCTSASGQTVSVHVFARTPTGRLGHWWYTPGAPWNYQDVPGGTVAGNPMCGAYSGLVHVVARDGANGLHHWWYQGGWKQAGVGAGITSDPAMTVYGNQYLVFARNSAGHLGEWWYTPGQGWATRDLGGSLVGAPSAGPVDDLNPRQTQVFARTATGVLHHWWWDAHTWRQGDAGTGLAADPVYLTYQAPNPDQQQVFARDSAGRLGQRWYFPGTGFRAATVPGAPHA
jgi:hypothetical protein